MWDLAKVSDWQDFSETIVKINRNETKYQASNVQMVQQGFDNVV